MAEIRTTTIAPQSREWLWMTVGALLMLAVVWLTHWNLSPGEQSRQTELLRRLELDLTAAATAEKSAVMSSRDADAQTFAAESRAGMARVEQARGELAPLLRKPSERKLMAEFTAAFAAYRRLNEQALDLAVQGSNLKAYDLAFGPAATAIADFDAALRASPVPAGAEARVAAWRLLAALPPHIAEESDAKMDVMEAAMTKLDEQIRRALTEIGDNPAAADAYRRFSELRAQILKLSRANTNVRSLALSLHQQRKALAACQETLAALQQAMQGDGAPRQPVMPR